MIKILFVLVISCSLVKSEKTLEPKVASGDKVDSIKQYSYSVLLATNARGSANFICGASVLNEKIVLTAAHCLICKNGCEWMTAFVGNINWSKGQKIPVKDHTCHEKFNKVKIKNDIGLVLLQTPLKLGKTVSRVAIMKKPPVTNFAKVAGWGLIDEVEDIRSDYLHFAIQTVIPFKNCRKILPRIADGTLCGGNSGRNQYASEGDSGSALVVQDYIQIGVVSFQTIKMSQVIVVYTDVAYFYDWIMRNSVDLYSKYDHCN